MSQPAASGLTFDARPLVEPIDRRAARDYAKRLRHVIAGIFVAFWLLMQVLPDLLS